MGVKKYPWKIIRTLDEDYCIIEEITKEHTATKLVSFDELETGKVVWDAPLIEAQMRAYDKALAQKTSQMNRGRR